jgi:hypothetical protein
MNTITASALSHLILTAGLSAAAAAALFVAWRRTGFRGFLVLSAVSAAHLAVTQLFHAGGLLIAYHFGTAPMVQAAVHLQTAKSVLGLLGIAGGLWVVISHLRRNSRDGAT